MRPTILFRTDPTNEEELRIACRHYIPVVHQRSEINGGLVIGRYSVLPFYQELEADLMNVAALLANSYEEHRYIANFEYYNDVADLTPKTYFSYVDIPEGGGPFVVKGRTNSRKRQWKKYMLAETKRRAVEIGLDLEENDALIGDQGIIVREFVPLKVLEVGLYDLPFSNEWRFFFWRERLIGHGYYWSQAEARGALNEEGMAFARRVAAIIAKKARFFVIDIAEKADGGWILIEVNDGQMSGLSEIDPNEFYRELGVAAVHEP